MRLPSVPSLPRCACCPHSYTDRIRIGTRREPTSSPVQGARLRSGTDHQALLHPAACTSAPRYAAVACCWVRAAGHHGVADPSLRAAYLCSKHLRLSPGFVLNFKV